MTTPPHDHRRAAADRRARVAVLTVSDSRNETTDGGGNVIVQLVEAEGHEVSDRRLVRDDPKAIESTIADWLGNQKSKIENRKSPQAILTTGGTGLAPRDTTVDVVERLIDQRRGKPIPGFGELFRQLSFTEIGPAAMLSRATAGLIGDTLIFTLPGSPHAIELALSRLILPELPHLLWERSR
jgi:molybdenum cofactor biosynthesis protein B